jgi:hypothetical protein
MRATQVKSSHSQKNMSSPASCGRPIFFESRKWVARMKRAMTTLFDEVEKTSPGWPAFAGHDSFGGDSIFKPAIPFDKNKRRVPHFPASTFRISGRRVHPTEPNPRPHLSFRPRASRGKSLRTDAREPAPLPCLNPRALYVDIGRLHRHRMEMASEMSVSTLEGII